ncbi:MAG: hypothetical protein ACXAEN_18940 [Candidatus Thorarchaeota archaeon]
MKRPTPLQLVFVLAAIIPVMPLTYQVFVGDDYLRLGMRSLFWAIELDRELGSYILVQEIQYSDIPPLLLNLVFLTFVGIGVQNAVRRGYAKRNTLALVAFFVLTLILGLAGFMLRAVIRFIGGDSFGMGIDAPFPLIFVLGFLLLFSMRERPLASPWDE